VGSHIFGIRGKPDILHCGICLVRARLALYLVPSLLRLDIGFNLNE
jgi:hypothetical protein